MTRKVTIELSAEAAKVLDEYAFRKIAKLEESGLSDSYCHGKLYEAHLALAESLKAV